MADTAEVTTPLISVLMPAFNAEATIETAIRSILGQSLGDLELVIQDDGSTDSTAAIVGRLAREDRRIVALPSFPENRGLVAARNSLLAHARGAFLAFMDADDLSLPDRLQRQASFLIDHPGVAAVGTAIRYADAGLRPLQDRRFPRDPDRQARDPEICCATVMARREAARKAGGFHPLFRLGGEDGDWLLRLAEHGAVTNLDEVLYLYRQHANTSGRHAGAIRRLGVLARHAARLRRAGQADPLERVVGPEDVGGLTDAFFLEFRGLSPEERLTALSLPLAGQPPLIAVLARIDPAGPALPRLLEGWCCQGFRNFELLVEGSMPDPVASIPGLQCRSVGNLAEIVGPAARWRRLGDASLVAWHDGATVPAGDHLEAQLRLLLAAEAQGGGAAILVARRRTAAWHESRALLQDEAQSLGHCPAFLLRRVVAEQGLRLIDGLWEWSPSGAAPACAASDAAASDGAGARQAFAHLQHTGLDGTALGTAYVASALRAVRRGQRSPLALPALALRHPRSFARASLDLLRRKAGLPAGPAPGEPSPPAAPAIVTRRRSEIVVSCLDDWGDLDDAMRHLTPGGGGLWGGVAFERRTAFAPDWHVVFNGPGRVPVDLDASPNRVLFAIGEPPTRAHRPLHEGQGDDTIVLTSDESLAASRSAPRRYVLAPAMTRTWSVRRSYAELRTAGVIDKPRRLSWVTSDVALLGGHRHRLAFLERLRGGIEFDLYGRGFRPIDDKWDGLAPYRYSIAFENTRAPYYFTEKLMDCFVAETMPLYVGSPAIERFFPREAMVILDPDDPGIIGQIRDVIASDLWARNREAIREAKRLVLETYNIFAYLAAALPQLAEPALPARRLRLEPRVPDFSAGG
jgi:GT2 family glycosyltransferase